MHGETRLIVVEDHAETAEGLKRFLNAVGYQVFIATDMASALSLASSVQFDVLLSDLGLPDGTGWDLLKRLSAERRIRAIAFSGYNTPADRKRSVEAGFLEHLAKATRPGPALRRDWPGYRGCVDSAGPRPQEEQCYPPGRDAFSEASDILYLRDSIPIRRTPRKASLTWKGSDYSLRLSAETRCPLGP